MRRIAGSVLVMLAWIPATASAAGWQQPLDLAWIDPHSTATIVEDGDGFAAAWREGPGNRPLWAHVPVSGSEWTFNLPSQVEAMEDVALAANTAGDVSVSWLQHGGDLYSLFHRGDDSDWHRFPGEIVRSEYPSHVSAAMNGHGDVLLAWVQDLSDGTSRIEAAFKPNGQLFGDPVTVADEYGRPEVALSDAGEAVVAWDAQDALRVAVGSAAGFGSAQTFGDPARDPRGVRVGVSAIGSALMAWREADDDGASYAGHLMASFRPAGGSFQPAVEVAPTWSPGSIDLAVTPSGAGLVGYAAPGPEAYQARPAVAEFDTLTQTFRAPQTFDTDLDGQLRVAASGSNAVAAWDTPDSVEAAQGDLVHGLGDASTAWCHGGGEGLVDAALVGSVPGLLVRAAQPSRYPEYNQNELFLLRGAGGGSPTCSQPAAPAPTAASAEPSAASSPSPDSSAVQVADPAPIPPEHAARPTISHVRLTRSALRFRLSRPAVVSVRFKRRGHTVAAFSLSCVAGENAHRLSKRLRRIIRTSRVKVSLSAS